MLGLGTDLEGRYEILRKLGEGGFGVVYEARQARTGQSVAIKVLVSPMLLDEQSEVREKRFLREAKLCAELSHPNIVPLLDAGRTEDGRYYTVFSYVPGVTLAQCLAREVALEPREAQHLMLQVLDALTCAHEHGIIHRDLKPSNIMLNATGARRNATVVDFGIAKDTLCPMNTPLTATRESLGTLGYCAPEQVRGNQLEPNADLFAWGVIFLECLTGKRVYDGTTAAQVLFQQLGSEPVPIPAVLERHPVGEVIRRATQKDPFLRQDTARELHQVLDACSVRDLNRDMLTGATPSRLATFTTQGVARNRTTELPISDKTELRQVAALCCCFDVSCTERREPLAGELDELMQACVTAAAQVARERGGYVVTALGHQLLVYHGLFESAEDDAIQACLVGKDIQFQLREQNQELASRGIRIVERMALHAGLVLTRRGYASDEIGLRVGVTARVAAEAAALAAPTSILATDAARNLLRQRFVLDLDSSRSVNGSRVDLYRVGELRNELSHTGPLDIQQSPFIGRKEEMDLLLSRWASSKGCAVLVTSSPGTGKTRLLREFRKRIRGQSCIFGEAHCAPTAQKHPLFPIIGLVQGMLEIAPQAPPDEQCARLELALARYGLKDPEYVQLLGQLLSLPIYGPSVLGEISPQKRKELTWNAIIVLLAAMAETDPVLLYIEDCQYADPSTCEFLNELLKETSATRIWVFLTARPEFTNPFSTTLLQLHLNRLEDSQTVALAVAVAGDKALPPNVLQQILHRTDGVPLFVEELTRAIIASRSLVESDDQYILKGTLEIPTTLRSLLTANLDRLGRAKETAQLAAVLGREFDRDLLILVSPGGPTAVDADLNRLMAAGLILQRRRVEDRRCVFRHALICDAAYESLPHAARIQAHACVAWTIENKFPALVSQRPDLLAHHHALADQRTNAVQYAQAASQLALDRSSYAEALSSVADVYAWLAALPANERVMAELRANAVKTQALMAVRGWGEPEVKALVDRSTALLTELEGNDALKVQFGWAKFAFCHTCSDRRGALESGNELLALAEASHDAAFLAAAHTMFGLARQVDGAFDEAARALDTAMKHYRSVDRETAKSFQMDSRALAEAIQGHLAYWTQGDDPQAFMLVESAIAWARELQHVPSIAIALLYGAQVYQATGDKQKVAAMADEILSLSAKYGLPAFEGYAATIAAWASGDVERVAGIVHHLETLGCKIGLSYWAAFPASIAAERGQFEPAIACIRRCIERCRENDEHYYEPELFRLLGEYLLVHDPGQEASACAALERAANLAQEQGMHRVELMARLVLQQRLGVEQEARIQALIAEHPRLRDVATSSGQFASSTIHNKETAHAC
jgi:TOMM system kinase/cyclase fusion protein